MIIPQENPTNSGHSGNDTEKQWFSILHYYRDFTSKIIVQINFLISKLHCLLVQARLYAAEVVVQQLTC